MGIMPILFGAILLRLGYIGRVRALRLQREGVATTGVVTDITAVSSTSIDGNGVQTTSTDQHVTVRFESADGRQFECVDPFGTLPQGIAVGVTVPVKYLAADPETMTIDVRGNPGGGSTALMAFGGMLILLGIAFIAFF